MEPDIISRISVSKVPAGQRHIIGNLLQLCLHDYSEFSPEWNVEPDGRFAYEWFDSYWQEVGRIPLLIQTDGTLIGFALINRWSVLDRSLDHAMAEFFILRKYRRMGVGSRAANLIFHSFPGRWEVAVAHNNAPALAFWHRAIPAAIQGAVEECERDDERWSGTVLCFTSRDRGEYRP